MNKKDSYTHNQKETAEISYTHVRIEILENLIATVNIIKESGSEVRGLDKLLLIDCGIADNGFGKY